jgi:GT2 family glycosyltransferase
VLRLDTHPRKAPSPRPRRPAASPLTGVSTAVSAGGPRRSTLLTVIVPATDQPATLERALTPIRAALHPGEELIAVTGPAAAGPAEARNAAARRATGEVLVFVDADVEIHPDALTRLRAAFDVDPGLTAVFGSYDDGPASPGVVSQFRNLLHHHVHQSCPGPAQTFWSGLGAVRRHEFLALDGFDHERFPMPSVEDIELGMRIVAAGGRIELHPKVQGTHLKHWSLWTMVRTDFLLRGIPWIEMILERRVVPASLNLSWRERTSTLLTVLAAPALALRRRRLFGGIVAALAVCDARFLWLIITRMGARRAPAGVALHALHRIVGLAAVPAGVLAHLFARGAGALRR